MYNIQGVHIYHFQIGNFLIVRFSDIFLKAKNIRNAVKYHSESCCLKKNFFILQNFSFYKVRDSHVLYLECFSHSKKKLKKDNLFQKYIRNVVYYQLESSCLQNSCFSKSYKI